VWALHKVVDCGMQNLVRAALVSTGSGTAEMVLSFGGPDTLRFKPSAKVPTNAPISELDGWVPGMASDPKLTITVRSSLSSTVDIVAVQRDD
jgi:hypothetical protein